MLKKKHPKVHIPKAKAPVVKMPKAEAKGKVMTPKVPGVNVKAHVRKPRVVHPGNPMSMSSADYAAHNDARTLKEAAMIHADPVRHKKARKHIDAELTADRKSVV